jgi:hypothetical protein
MSLISRVKRLEKAIRPQAKRKCLAEAIQWARLNVLKNPNLVNRSEEEIIEASRRMRWFLGE